MKTFFASPHRSDFEVLERDLDLISQNPVIDGLMNFVSGLFAVLNQDRQVIALNNSFFELIGIEDTAKFFGLRLGEVVDCIHSRDMPGGCGTSRFCSSCGAAISMVAVLGRNKADERTCSLEVMRNDRIVDLFLSIKCCPLDIDGRRFLLLFVQDISKEQQIFNLKKVFFHDISNTLVGLLGRCELLLHDHLNTAQQDLKEIYDLSLRIASEIAIQKNFFSEDTCIPNPVYCDISADTIFDELKTIYKKHTAVNNKKLVFKAFDKDIILRTDRSLILRILCNMITNALEASTSDDEVRVFFDVDESKIIFSVWNRTFMPENISLRIFQRNFSTKKGLERGLGTYSMKFFGETILNGIVSFKTSEDKGTVFSLTLDIL